jgi:hypothetical protein
MLVILQYIQQYSCNTNVFQILLNTLVVLKVYRINSPTLKLFLIANKETKSTPIVEG